MHASVVETSWGPWHALRMRDERVSVTVVPQVGGRVVSLRDEATGREWLMQGDPPDARTLERWAGEEATYGGRESFGWDECLPTVTRCPDPVDPDAPSLRDHGDQWGRPCELSVDPSMPAITTTWPSPRWPLVLQRRLSLPGGGVVRADYTLASRSAQPMPVLWSAHPALQLEPGTRLELPGVTDVRLVGVVGWPIEPGERVPWPEPAAGWDLSGIHPIEASGAVKLYAGSTLARAHARDGSVLAVEADGDPVRTMGVWIDAGGWPLDGTPIHQTAFEPTSSPDDHVADALAHGRAWTLPPNGTLRWWMSFRLGAGTAPQALGNA
ncbi:MAG: hypothetical protein ABWZ82_12145 [Candidatus Limnocylindrales bacterium]